MSQLAVIGTFHGRYENTEPVTHRVLLNIRPGDEFWMLCEDEEDEKEAVWSRPGWAVDATRIIRCPTPRAENGQYAVIPYSNKINFALDRTDADYIVYLDNGSMPHPDKYRLMSQALDENPEWGAVYCTQRRTGYDDYLSVANEVVPDAYCRLNFTQVMHRRTDDRWTLDMRHANPDLADALFWRSLHATLGPFYPVAGDIVLDEHEISGPAAQGL